jgi:dephospho-CoA kinase
MIVGLTGGIASGKSTVAQMFRHLGAHVLDADVIARQVVEKGTTALQEIVDAFGPDVLQEDGTLDRPKLGAIVFRDEEARKRLNRIVHPRVREQFEMQTREYLQHHPDGILIHDIPLLYENGLERTVDVVVVVSVTPQTQILRLMERNGLTRVEAEQRIAAQMPLAEKVKRADYVIDNEGTLHETEQQVNRIWNRWKQGLNL